ncbi:MAG: PEP-CTERM sorting domain-containing protein [Planctomycetota bacterium]
MTHRSFWFTALPAAVSLLAVGSADADLLIQGVIDGDLPGGLPKAIVLRANSPEGDLSQFAVGSATNGGGTDGPEAQLTGSANAGDFILVVFNADSQNFFSNNFTDSFIFLIDNVAANINGNDAIELFFDPGSGFGGSETVIDTYGQPTVNGTGQFWEYTDGYAARIAGGADPTFADGGDNYSINEDALDTLTEDQQADLLAGAFGWTRVPEPGSLALLAIGSALLARRRR